MTYFRTKSQGELANIKGSTQPASGESPAMPNTGVSIITATSAEIYILQPPVAGCEKTIVFHTYSTTALPIVKTCTAAAGTITFMGPTTTNTCMKSAATKSTGAATVVTLKGINSTQWLITSVWPTMAGVTTGTTIVASGITLSST